MTAKDLIEEARAARSSQAARRAVREEVRQQARKIAQMRSSRKSEEGYLASLEKHMKRERAREAMYDDLRAVLDLEAGRDTEGARRVKAQRAAVTRSALAARKAGDPLNLTGHTKVKKKQSPPEETEFSDVKDPHDGGTVRVKQNWGESTVSHWFRHRLIDSYELQAADWFRAKYEQAAIGVIRAQDLEKPITDGGLPATSLADTALLAAVTVQQAKERVQMAAGQTAFLVLEEIVGQGRAMKEVVPRHTNLKYKMADGYVIGLVRDALNAIVRWKGMRPAPEAKISRQSNGRGGSVVAENILSSHGPFSGTREIEIDHTGSIRETVKSRILHMESSERRRMRERDEEQKLGALGKKIQPRGR